MDSWVVLGTGIPEGETSYVLTRRNFSEYTLWNACTGKCYQPEDPMCPLVSVGAVFDAQNVYANVQTMVRPGEISWNFSDPKCWRPFL